MGEYFLFARPSFLSGMARVLDLGATLDDYNTCLNDGQADSIALRSDWDAVGGDLRAAMGKFDEVLPCRM